MDKTAHPPDSVHGRPGRSRWLLVLGLALLFAVAGPRSLVTWNDGSRLAAVESLADYGTWAIDDSIFVSPSRVEAGAPSPYGLCPKAGEAERSVIDRLIRLTAGAGTADKMWIGGNYYSDKSPVPSLLMAGLYKVIRWATGLTARSQPDLFIYAMGVATAGIPYVGAVAAIYALALRFLRRGPAFALTASFALATAAPIHTRQVNIHIVLLAVAAAVMLALDSFRRRLEEGGKPRLLAAGIGGLAGFGYGTDLGTGIALIVTLVPLVAFRCRMAGREGVKLFGIFLIAALPWIAAHHGINYRIGGSFAPAGADARHFEWPGSPWSQEEYRSILQLTGTWKHPDLGSAVQYALEFLVRFIGTNPALLLAVPGWFFLLRREPPLSERPELLFGMAWSLLTWALYSALTLSNNWFIRWFVPLLAPGYYVLAVLLRERPRLLRELLMLSAGGFVIAASSWGPGPWGGVYPEFGVAIVTVVLVWLALRIAPRFSQTPALTTGGGQ